MLTKKQEKLYSLSLEEANKSNMLFKHGCVATYGGHVIASGYNTHKSYSSHDEFLQKQCEKYIGATIKTAESNDEL